MDALAAYESDDSDEDNSSPASDANPSSSTSPKGANPPPVVVDQGAGSAASEPARKRPRQSKPMLPYTSTDDWGKNMVQWPIDYLTAKLQDADQRLGENGTATTTGSTSSVFSHLANKPKNWIDILINDPEFTNPHQLEAVAVGLGIRRSVAPIVVDAAEPLQDWETIDRLQELERDALIKLQHQYEQER